MAMSYLPLIKEIIGTFVAFGLDGNWYWGTF
jgi:hypothetical protein